MFKQGENQIKEIINAGKTSIFFIDKFHKVTIDDYGSIEIINEIANGFDAEVEFIKLESQLDVMVPMDIFLG